MTDGSFPGIVSGLILLLIMIGIVGSACSKRNNSTNLSINTTAPPTPISNIKKNDKNIEIIDIKISNVNI